MKKNININDLNFATWLAITSVEFNSHEANAAVVDYLEQFRTMGYNVYMSGTHRYNDEVLMQKELQIMGEDADPSIYTHQIKDGKKGLLKCRKQFPDFLKCFIEEDNEIYLRCSPYFIFEERLMYRIGLLLPEIEHSLEMAG